VSLTLFKLSHYIILNNFIAAAAVESNDIPDSELAVEEEGIATDAAAAPDDGRDAHDSVVIKTTHDKAIEIMRAEGIEINSEESKMALQLFPRVSINLSQLNYTV
jgi:hypothetical protein